MKDTIKELGRAFMLGVIIFLVVNIIQYVNGNWDVDDLWKGFAVSQLFSIALYSTNTIVIRFVIKRYKSKLFQFRNIIISLTLGALVTIITIFLLNLFLSVGIYNGTFDAFIQNQNINQYWSSFLIAMLIISVFYAFYYWKHKQDNRVKESKIIAGTASAKFDALKNQLDPHFLFNSLNVLTSLIDENPNQAQKFTTSLSKVYRYVLEQKNKELVSVDEELAFAKTYMNLIKMRFEDSIIFEMPEHSSNPDAKVVPLSLQLLLENAVKHNMVTPSRKLHIRIYEEQGSLVVSNTKQLKQVVKKSSGVGLQNIKQRYHLLTDRKVTIDEGDTSFSVAIPMLTKQQAFVEVQETYIEDKKYKRAKEKLDKIKGFYIHATVYMIMVPVFIWLNYTSTSFPWAIFPIVGWGFGILGHASEAFEWHPVFNKNWEERKIKELMDDDQF